MAVQLQHKYEKKKNREIIIIILICDRGYLQEGWNGRKAARFSGANVVQSSQIFIITNEKTLVFSCRFLRKKTADMYISGNFVRKRPQTYSTGNFVRNNLYQRGRNFFLVFHVPSWTNLHKPKNLPSKLKSPLCIFQRIGLLGRVLSKVFYRSHWGKNFALSWMFVLDTTLQKI